MILVTLLLYLDFKCACNFVSEIPCLLRDSRSEWCFLVNYSEKHLTHTSKTEFTSINVCDEFQRRSSFDPLKCLFIKFHSREEANFRSPVWKLHSLPLFLQIALIVSVAASGRNNSWSITVSRNSAPGILTKAKIKYMLLPAQSLPRSRINRMQCYYLRRKNEELVALP